ncbi:unnamed protein product [Pedinophyceae sp. YPF-701]|nr:unnamed protein product [Pedinophyceae sp. YPF-701]
MEVTQDNFDAEVLQADKPVLAKFWANWCGPCKLIDPLVKQIEESYSGNLKVVSVEVDSNPELTEKYDVYGLPTLMLFRGGEFVEGTKHEGAISKDKISAYLESHGIPAA